MELLGEDEGLAVAVFSLSEEQEEHESFEFVSVLFLHFGHFVDEGPVLHEYLFVLLDEH